MVPDGAHAALTQAVDADHVDRLDDASAAHLERGPVRSVYVSTTPTALVITAGDPEFAPVEGTSLLSVTNTTSCVLRDRTDQELYVLVSGRWFRSWTTNGPWRHVPDDELPADLAATNHLVAVCLRISMRPYLPAWHPTAQARAVGTLLSVDFDHALFDITA